MHLAAPLNFNLTGGARFSGASGDGWTLSAANGAADNPPSAPATVAPVRAPVSVSSPTSFAGTLPPFTFAVMSFALA